MGSFVRSLLINVFLVLMIIADFFVISNLMTSVAGQQLLLSSFSNLVFIGIIDILPIFVLTPALNKILKGVVAKNTDKKDYNTKMVSVWISLLLFVAVVAIYFAISVSNPERFLIDAADSLSSIVPVSMGDNSELLSIIFGLMPLMTTLLSCLCNFINIGTKYIEEEIEKCQNEIEKIKKKKTEVESTETFLNNLSSGVRNIRKHIDHFISSIDDLKEDSNKEENRLLEQTKDLLRADVIRKFGVMRQSGDALFINWEFQGVDPEFQKWQSFMGVEEERLRGTINVI